MGFSKALFTYLRSLYPANQIQFPSVSALPLLSFIPAGRDRTGTVAGATDRLRPSLLLLGKILEKQDVLRSPQASSTHREIVLAYNFRGRVVFKESERRVGGAALGFVKLCVVLYCITVDMDAVV